MADLLEKAKLLDMYEIATKNALQDLQPTHLVPLILQIVKDVFLAGLIQGNLKRNVNLEQVFEFLKILKINEKMTLNQSGVCNYDGDAERIKIFNYFRPKKEKSTSNFSHIHPNTMENSTFLGSFDLSPRPTSLPD